MKFFTVMGIIFTAGLALVGICYAGDPNYRNATKRYFNAVTK